MQKLTSALFVVSLVLAHSMLFAQAGSLDLAFGTGGKVTTQLSATGNNSQATCSALQSDGKIVVAGYAYNSNNNIDIVLARYHSNGSLDMSFDGDGKVTTDLGDTLDFCHAMAIQNDGKIVLVGETNNYSEIVVLRYNTNGSLDNTFDSDGILITSIGSGTDRGSAIAIQNDGKIVAAANCFNGSTGIDFGLMRLNTNGSFDLTFDTDGKLLTNIYGDDIPYGIMLQTDGKIVVAGSCNSSNLNTDFTAVRYHSNGSLDLSFDMDGIARTSITPGYDIPTSLAIQNDGKIILSGHSGGTNMYGHAMVRYNTDGSLDTNFDTDGIVLNTLTSFSGDKEDIKIQNDGKLVVTGINAIANFDFLVMRYNASGSLDLTFDNDGMVTTFFGSSLGNDFASSTHIQNDGKIIAVGCSNGVGPVSFALARFNPDNPLELSNFSSSSLLTLFPNPTTGILKIEYQENDYRIQILNSIGQQVDLEDGIANKSEVDVKHLSKGIYFVVLQSNSKTYFSRFVKE